MSSMVRAELIKLRSTRMPLWLLLTALGLVVLLVVVTVPTRDGSDALSLHDSDLLARVVGVGTAAGQVVMLVLGILPSRRSSGSAPRPRPSWWRPLVAASSPGRLSRSPSPGWSSRQRP